MKATLPPDEATRLRTLRELALLDTAPEPVFDDLAQLAAQICATPMAIVSLVDERRQWLKARVGIALTETPRDSAFCAQAILQPDEVLHVADATRDVRFRDNPLVTGESHVRFYAGIPLTTSDGHGLGALAVMDRQARALSPEQLRALRTLGRLVVSQIQLRQQGRNLEQLDLHASALKGANERLAQDEVLMRIAGRTAKLGGWAVSLPDQAIAWSRETATIHDEPAGFAPTLDGGIGYYAPEYRAVVREKIVACARDGTPFEFEARLRTAKGRLIWVRSLGEAVRNAAGTIVRIQGTVQDITAQKDTEASLADSLRQFRLMADAMPFIVWTAGPDGAVDYSNRHFFAYTGVRPEAEPGGRWQGCVHPDDLPRALEIWAAANAREEEYRVEFRLRRHSDGAYRWFNVQALPVWDTNGRLARWYGTGIDVHESKQLEQSARRAAERLCTTLESIGDAFCTLDPEWRFTYVNAQAELLCQMSREQMLGRNHWELFPETRGSTFEREYFRARTEGVAVGFEAYYAPLLKWFEVRAYPSPEGLAVFFRDVTSRRQTEAKLREQATLLDKAKDAILVRDLEHRVKYWNKGAEQLYGWTAAEAVGKSVRDLIYDDAGELLTGTAIAVRDGEWLGEITQQTKAGTKRTVEGRWTLVRDDEGRPTGILCINSDITERRKLEQQFLRAQRMESIGTLAGGIAHDLNNLLSPITIGVQLLRLNEPDAESLSIIDNIETSARRGTNLVKQVLSFARGVDGARVALQVKHVIRELIAILESTFPKNIDIVASVPFDLWPILGDATQVHQVLLNLCVNARDAMPEGGRLTVRGENRELDAQYAQMERGAAVGRYIVIEVTDTGCGIPREIVDRIFEPFFTTKEQGKGTGLGLSTVMGIVHSHGGFVNVTSEPGRGARFQVYLPAQAEGERGDSASPIPVPDQFPRGQGELVLVVDDEASILQITRQTLEAFGYRVIVAVDGAQAIALYATRAEEISVVLTDMMMPVMDGSTLIAALRRLNPAVRIVGASGLAGNASKVAAAGVKEFLPKPYSADTMLATIRRVLRE
jgi:PAS domain S-box-containing protein